MDIHDAALGKIQGLFEPFIVTERGTINKEKFYIPNLLLLDTMERHCTFSKKIIAIDELLLFYLATSSVANFSIDSPVDNPAFPSTLYRISSGKSMSNII